MRMGFFFSSAFWGILLILWGLSMVLKTFLPKLNFPLGTIFISVCVIIFGLQLLFSSMGIKSGWFGKNHSHKSVTGWSEGNVNTTDGEELNVFFSNGSMEISGDTSQVGNKRYEVNAIFGRGIVYVTADVPVVVEANAVFGKVYKDKRLNYATSENNAIYIEANAVFGSVDIIVKN
jgi:predicted membrane protein